MAHLRHNVERNIILRSYGYKGSHLVCNLQNLLLGLIQLNLAVLQWLDSLTQRFKVQ